MVVVRCLLTVAGKGILVTSHVLARLAGRAPSYKRSGGGKGGSASPDSMHELSLQCPFAFCSLCFPLPFAFHHFLCLHHDFARGDGASIIREATSHSSLGLQPRDPRSPRGDDPQRLGRPRPGAGSANRSGVPSFKATDGRHHLLQGQDSKHISGVWPKK